MTLDENNIQRAVFKHLKQRGAPGVFAFHPKNGGVHQRGRRSGINTGLGVIPGVPDIIVIKQGKTFCLELKADTGKVSPAQLDTMKAMAVAGATVGVTHGLDAALRWLEENQLLVGRAA